jgi:hypothetical protein
MMMMGFVQPLQCMANPSVLATGGPLGFDKAVGKHGIFGALLLTRGPLGAAPGPSAF